jgi:uncharacterized protein
MPSPGLGRHLHGSPAARGAKIVRVTDIDELQLTAEEGRVVGCLVEKQATVPDTYPMTLNALRGACNQSSNRDPLVAYDDGTVLRALDGLKAKGLVRFVHAAHGSRTTRYRQVLDEAMGLDPGELATLSVLLLRGPQTAAEIRARAERQHPFDSVSEVDALLEGMAMRPAPLVRLLPREPGRHEPRWVQLVSADAASVPPAAAAAHGPVPSAEEAGDLAELRQELAELRRRFDLLLERLGETDL